MEILFLDYFFKSNLIVFCFNMDEVNTSPQFSNIDFRGVFSG